MSIKDKLKELPTNPGCYLMKNIDNTVIYVGKAKNLSNRVKSYFTGSHNAKTTRLVMDIVDFEYIITSSEKEAFILEINLIKKYRPRYNIMLMDDKRYPYIVVSNERHPKIYYTRELNKKGKYYGPYPNSLAAKQTVEMLNKIYPLRKCNKIPKKECLYYHMNNCLAPCINEVSKESYLEITKKINQLLRGNVNDEIRSLKEKMDEASENLNFERAIEIRNIINNLEIISEKQKMETSIKDADIFNYSSLDDYINIQVFHIRDSKVIERDCFTYDLVKEEKEIFSDFIMTFYLINNNPIPKEIIVPQIELDSFSDEIRDKMIIPKQGKKKELLDLLLVNINKELNNQILKHERTYEMTVGATIELAKILSLDIPSCDRIEAFDNSNIMGVSAVSAMVCYVNGVKSPKDYRKYKVKTVIGANDVGTFKEIIARRYKRVKEENEKMPDLLIIDGGRGQVNASLEALKEIDVKLNVIGLVKDDFHRTDKILYNDELISIDKKSNLFKFLTNIQDEVHRYAISFHRETHTKKLIESKLDSIKGIGKVKRGQILAILGDIDFEDKIHQLKLTEEQISEVLKIYKS